MLLFKMISFILVVIRPNLNISPWFNLYFCAISEIFDFLKTNQQLLRDNMFLFSSNLQSFVINS